MRGVRAVAQEEDARSPKERRGRRISRDIAWDIMRKDVSL